MQGFFLCVYVLLLFFFLVCVLFRQLFYSFLENEKSISFFPFAFTQKLKVGKW